MFDKVDSGRGKRQTKFRHMLGQEDNGSEGRKFLYYICRSLQEQ